MSPLQQRMLVWAPRVLCLAFAAFIGLFALDAFEPSRSLGANLVAFARHLTPTFVILLTLALAWRWPAVGGTVLILAGAYYAMQTGPRGHLSWIVVVAGPAWLTGLLFLLSARASNRRPAAS